VAAEHDPATRTLPVVGVVDFVSAPEVQRAGVGLLSEPGVTGLVIDLAGVTFIDSSGLSVLVYLKGRCDERKIGLALTGLPPRARALIDSLGLSAYFDLPAEA
jgi:anti-sigma B factor antagonist